MMPLGAFARSDLGGGFRSSGLGAWANSAELPPYAGLETKIYRNGTQLRLFDPNSLYLSAAAMTDTWQVRIVLGDGIDVYWREPATLDLSAIWDDIVGRLYATPANIVPTEQITRVSNKVLLLDVTPQVSGQASEVGGSGDCVFSAANTHSPPTTYSETVDENGDPIATSITGIGPWQEVGYETLIDVACGQTTSGPPADVQIDGSLESLWGHFIGAGTAPFPPAPIGPTEHSYDFSAAGSFSGHTITMNAPGAPNVTIAKFTDTTGSTADMAAGLLADFNARNSGNLARFNGVTLTRSGSKLIFSAELGWGIDLLTTISPSKFPYVTETTDGSGGESSGADATIQWRYFDTISLRVLSQSSDTLIGNIGNANSVIRKTSGSEVVYEDINHSLVNSQLAFARVYAAGVFDLGLYGVREAGATSADSGDYLALQFIHSSNAVA